ncbi:hypothetical protein BHM03_00058487, partial [Ensete ventricosum]
EGSILVDLRLGGRRWRRHRKQLWELLEKMKTAEMAIGRTVVSIPNGPSTLAVKEAAWGLARYAAISQDNGLVPIVEPEILLDGDNGIERTFEVAQIVSGEVFFYLAENNVMFEGILLKPSMVTPGAESKEKATPEQVAEYTLKLLHKRIPPAVPGIMASPITSSNNDWLRTGY